MSELPTPRNVEDRARFDNVHACGEGYLPPTRRTANETKRVALAEGDIKPCTVSNAVVTAP